MSELVKCLQRNVYVENGVKIMGHVYEPSVAIHDAETDRTYFIDHCIRCGHKSVNFVKTPSKHHDVLVADYTEILKVG